MLLALSLLAAQQIAQTPPMGWNSYDCFNFAVNEAEVMANADVMAKRLKPLGWEYVVVDYIWSMPRSKTNYSPAQNENFEPRMRMDEFGRLLPDVARFPSAKGNAGFAPLADRLHKMGLKFGIHLMRGIPRQAVAANTAVRGSKFTAIDAANQKSICVWCNHMYGLNMTSRAGQAYLDSIFALYAKWGVDFVKVDDLSRPYSAAEVEGYHKAILHSGRPMILSLSPGPAPLDQGEHLDKNANMWRLLDDLWDNWAQLNAAFDKVAEWVRYQKPGAWPDPDMLPLGRLRKLGPATGPANTDSLLTADEQQTMMTLWSIMRCPLMVGGHLPETTEATFKLLTNPEVVEVNQHARNSHALVLGPTPIYVARSEDGKSKYAAVFSRKSNDPTAVTIRLSDLGIQKCRVRDLWSHTDLPIARNTLTVVVPKHGSKFFRLDPIVTCPQTEPIPYKMSVLGTSYEAESPTNTFGGNTHAEKDPVGKASGGSTVKYVGNGPLNTVQFNGIKAAHSGRFVVTVVYASGEDRIAKVSVNGGKEFDVHFSSTGGYDGDHLDTQEFEVELKAGENTIRFGDPTHWSVDIDRIAVRPRG